MSALIIAQTISIHPSIRGKFWRFLAFSVTGNACQEYPNLQSAALQVYLNLSTSAMMTAPLRGCGLPSIPVFGGAGGEGYG